MKRDRIDLGKTNVSNLFRIYFFPTLFGMLSLCIVTAADGIFVGQGVGSDGLAAVNICIAPCMFLVGIGLMLGMGASVICSIHLAENNVKAARLNMTQAIIVGSLIICLFLAVSLWSPVATAMLLGSSESLLKQVTDYMPWIFLCTLFQMWGIIGLFIVRLDGSPKYAMWCNVIPGILNVILDYVFIFPLNMGILGAGIATAISCFIGGVMVLGYLAFYARQIRFIRLKRSIKSLRLTMRNIGYQCRIGVSAFIGETTMGILMLMGNIVFMKYLGNDGVGAFSIACYYAPFVFMIGNAIAQSAQPIISYNYGLKEKGRVVATERIAIICAVISGLIVMGIFILFPKFMVGLFLGEGNTSQIAIHGLPFFSSAFVFFIFNLTAIGYFQSVEKVWPSITFALFRGLIFLVPAYLLLPGILDVAGIWLAPCCSEFLTTISIIIYYLYGRNKKISVVGTV